MEFRYSSFILYFFNDIWGCIIDSSDPAIWLTEMKSIDGGLLVSSVTLRDTVRS